MDVLTSWLVLLDSDEVNHWLEVEIDLHPTSFLLRLVFFGVVGCLGSRQHLEVGFGGWSVGAAQRVRAKKARAHDLVQHKLLRDWRS